MYHPKIDQNYTLLATLLILKFSVMEPTRTTFHHYTESFQVIERLEDLANHTFATLNLHYREDLSCMHLKYASEAKSAPCPQHRRLRDTFDSTCL